MLHDTVLSACAVHYCAAAPILSRTAIGGRDATSPNMFVPMTRTDWWVCLCSHRGRRYLGPWKTRDRVEPRDQVICASVAFVGHGGVGCCE